MPPSQDVLQKVLDLLLEDTTPNYGRHHDLRDSSIRLSRIDSKIACLPLALEALSKEADARCLDLRRLRNSLAAINHLPVEILADIFDHSTDTTEDPTRRHYQENLHALAQVCSLWKDIVLGSPKLWASVDLASSEVEVMTAPRLSKAHPLNVFSEVSFDHPAMWLPIAQEIHRWEVARVSLTKKADFTRLETEAAPSLKTLSLSVLAQDTTPAVLDLFSGRAPNLRSLTLFAVAFREWNSSLLRGLHSLSIVAIYRSGPSVREILDVLRACPDLRQLDLISVSFLDDAASSSSDVTTLPDLQMLTIGSQNLDHMTSILQRIRAPYCTYFSFGSSHSTDETTEYPDALALAVLALASPSLRAHIVADTLLTIGVEPGKFWLTLPSDNPSSPRFNISLNHGIIPVAHVGDFIFNLSNSDPSIHPALSVPITGRLKIRGNGPDVLPILQGLPQLTLLTFECDDELYHMDGILSELSSPTASLAGGVGWLCPNLRRVEFRNCRCSDTGLLPRVIEKRVRSCMEAESGDGEGAVAMIESVEMVGGSMMDERTFNELVEYLGKKASWVDRNQDM